MAVEDFSLDFAHVVFDAGDDRLVVVDDVVDDGVQDRSGSALQQFRSVFQARAHTAERGRRVVPYVQHGVWRHEDLDLTEVDLLDVVDVPRRLQHQEQCIVVLFELRSLMGVERIFDHEIMEIDVQPYLFELGLRRIQETSPAERVVAADGAPVGGVEPAGFANPVDIEGAVDDHASDRRTRQSASMTAGPAAIHELQEAGVVILAISDLAASRTKSRSWVTANWNRRS